jgi:hypothetical protein
VICGREVGVQEHLQLERAVHDVGWNEVTHNHVIDDTELDHLGVGLACRRAPADL